jgi:hypothetical protein
MLNNPDGKKEEVSDWLALLLDLVLKPEGTTDHLIKFNNLFFEKLTGRKASDHSEILSNGIEMFLPLSKKNVIMLYAPHINEPIEDFWFKYVQEQLALKNDLVQLRVIANVDQGKMIQSF